MEIQLYCPFKISYYQGQTNHQKNADLGSAMEGDLKFESLYFYTESILT